LGLSGEVVLDELLSVLCVVVVSEAFGLSEVFESEAFEVSEGAGVSADGEATLLPELELWSDGEARLPELPLWSLPELESLGSALFEESVVLGVVLDESVVLLVLVVWVSIELEGLLESCARAPKAVRPNASVAIAKIFFIVCSPFVRVVSYRPPKLEHAVRQIQ
jgi:hypothetical protein